MSNNNKRKTNLNQIKSQLKNVTTEVKDGVFVYSGPTTIGELSRAINVPANEIILYFFKKGKVINLNMTLDEEQIAEVAINYDFDFQKEKEVNASNFMDEVEIIDEEKELQQRPPIITVMGHVDHGKTTLIDKIRNSNITSGEAGGITQHTGAYQVEHKKQKITFLDTPGHEAFTSMRLRGAQLTDIVILVVAADDGVMPQTKEAIEHSKAAGVPIIVFVNKMDKPGANLDKVRGDLAQQDIVSEEWQGDYQFVYGSALKGEGIDKLFDAINIQSEVLELKANPNRLAIGVVIESRIDKGRGAIATVIVQNGTLKPRDFIVAGSHYGKIRSLKSTSGEDVEATLPGEAAVITGLNYTPKAGDKFFGFEDEKFAKNLANQKTFLEKQKDLKEKNSLMIKDGVKVLNIIIKADVQGTTEAVKYSLAKIKNDEAQVNVVASSVGMITKSDVSLAEVSNSIIYGFNIRPTGDVKQLADQQKIMIKTHTIIYKMIEEVEELLSGMKAPVFDEKVFGQAQILKVIFSSKHGNIAGSKVIYGEVRANSLLRLIREGKTIHEGKLESLQVGKDQSRKVANNKEFGTVIKKFDDIREGDIIECYEHVEVKR